MVNAALGAGIQENASRVRPVRAWAVQVLKAVLWLVALAYLLTSAIVIINAFAWLPGLPDVWYAMQHALYWPFQPYFTVMGKLLGNPSISYGAFVVIVRAPFILIALAAMVVLIGARRRQN
ncbi:MAG: hypothetical protein Q7T05_07810 [Dehalococcoidia bacterium]|nr:hypothetical protein [Dehalococcoidia bacterium]